MRTSLQTCLLITLLVSLLPIARAIDPHPVDLAARENWVKQKFEAPGDSSGGVKQPLVGIEVIDNHNSVSRNRSHEGAPIRLGNRTFARGLYTHAHSKLIVRLPSAAEKFTAMIGVDNNHSTSGGRGSVRFHVFNGETSLFRSPIMWGGEEGVPIEINLNGATEFVLLVDDAGDGISCDQSEWVNPEVHLKDGTVLKLEEMPIFDPRYDFEPTSDPPFSFEYGGKSSRELLKNWNPVYTKQKIDDTKTERTVTWTDPETGLQVCCVATEYVHFPTIEWILYFKNTGTTETPILQKIQSMDTLFPQKGNREHTLHYAIGSPCTPEDFKPLKAVLRPGQERRVATSGGRPSDAHTPYFNIESGGSGWIFVVGWAGQWSSLFQNTDREGFRITAGQELTHFKLYPGEEVRSPISVLQFWTGDRDDSQNVWRRWMFEHNLPRPGGTLESVLTSHGCSAGYYHEMVHADAASQIRFIDGYIREKIGIGFWWMDAGWYTCTDWPVTGTWEVDPKRFPNGFKEISDHSKPKGVEIIVWFEPERVHDGTWLANERPEWLLKGSPNSLLDLGNPEALRWLIDHIDGMIKKEGIAYYRQDFNMEPLGYWRRNDAPDRQGITEIRHVCGYLEYWDALLERNPGLRIDTCASGGRRDDLETLRRSVPLHRSDYRDNASNQGQSYGLAPWIPVFGVGTHGDQYAMRSGLTPCITLGCDMREGSQDSLGYNLAREQIALWERSKKFWFGDYYPLSGYSLDTTLWIAWQYHLPASDEGMVQVFRREQSEYLVASYRLRGLNPEVSYLFEDADGGTLGPFSGRELMESGLRVEIPERPAGKVYFYAAVK